MSGAIHSPSTQHKQAASDHELAALQHRTAAEFHDKSMLHAARLSSQDAWECCTKAHEQSVLACEHSADRASPVGTARREPAIRLILDARFSLAALEASKNGDPAGWNSARNDMARGIYGEAMRESRRLEDATDAELEAELSAIGTWPQDHPRRVEAFQTD